MRSVAKSSFVMVNIWLRTRNSSYSINLRLSLRRRCDHFGKLKRHNWRDLQWGYPIGAKVGHVKNEDAELLEPAAAERREELAKPSRRVPGKDVVLYPHHDRTDNGRPAALLRQRYHPCLCGDGAHVPPSDVALRRPLSADGAASALPRLAPTLLQQARNLDVRHRARATRRLGHGD